MRVSRKEEEEEDLFVFNDTTEKGWSGRGGEVGLFCVCSRSLLCL
jgi:hypothetical protein